MLREAGAPPAPIDWEQAPVRGRRRETLLRTLQRLRDLCPGPACIVETGTLRDDSEKARDSDGWSTLAWAWYCALTGGRVVTVDVEPGNLEVCRRVTAPYAGVMEYAASDSIRFLREWRREQRGEIHLLYLDSLDYFPHQREESEAHHHLEAAAALPALSDRCLVLLDDTRPAEPWRPGELPRFTGKGARVIPFLARQGFQLEWARGEQALLSGGAGVDERWRHEPRNRQGALAASA